MRLGKRSDLTGFKFRRVGSKTLHLELGRGTAHKVAQKQFCQILFVAEDSEEAATSKRFATPQRVAGHLAHRGGKCW